MYDGSTLNFLGYALYYRSPIGLLLTLWVLIVYKVGQHFEDYYTNLIYSEAAKKKGENKPKKQVKKKEN